MRFVSIEEGEWGHFHGVMQSRVVMELSGREELYPFCGVVTTEDVKIGFKLLIGLFSLTICLRVIHSGEVDIVLEEMG